MKRFPKGLAVSQSPLFPYGVSILLAAAAFALAQSSPLHNGPAQSVLFLAAVLLSSRFGGLRSGLVASLLTIAATAYLLLLPNDSPRAGYADAILAVGVFAVIALAVCWLTATREGAWRKGLKVTLSGIGDGAIVTDPSGNVISMNAAAQALTGWNQAEAVSRPIDQVCKISDQNTGRPIDNPVIAALSTGELVRIGDRRGDMSTPQRAASETVSAGDEARPGQGPAHATLVTKSGRRIPVEGTAATLFDDAGRVLGAVVVLSDISVRRQAEESLRHSVERFRIALKNSPVVVSNQDTTLRYTWVYNPTRGFPPPSAVGKTDADLMSAAEAARWTEIKRGVLASGLGTREELTATVEGERRAFDLTVELMRDADGSIAGVTCTSIDITERKREQATTARLAAIVESSEDAITGSTLDGVIQSWNPGAERLYGYKPDEIIGRPHSILVPPERQDEIREIAERMKQGEPLARHDTVRIRKDGSPIDVSVTLSPVRDNMGRIIGLSSIGRDITQRRRAEDVQRFRAEASDALSASLDYERTLAAVARLAVPRMADCCAVHLLAQDGTIRQIAFALDDPAREEQVQEALARRPLDPNAAQGVPNVIRTGQPEFVAQVTAEQRAAMERGRDPLGFLGDLECTSTIVVPLTMRRHTFGALSFACSESGRCFTPDDLALAQDLAYRAALWGDNARLFQELQQVNQELEQRVAQRTVELQAANQQLHDEIAVRQRTNEQLRQLSAHLQSAREEERIRVAREIHDELGQILTAVRMDLDLLERDLSQPDQPSGTEETPIDLHVTMRLVDDSIQKMHEIIRELRPEILDHLGLQAAIEWQAQEFQTRSGIECRVPAAGDELVLDRDRSTAIFRIFQEALTNVARHAQATQVEIRLCRDDRQVILEVRDNGRGIAESEIADTRSFGILGMRERALVFGGHVDLHSEPGQGTVVAAFIPLEGFHDSNSDRR